MKLHVQLLKACKVRFRGGLLSYKAFESLNDPWSACVRRHRGLPFV